MDPDLVPRLVELLRHPDRAARTATRLLIDEIRFYEEQKRALAGGEAAAAPGPAYTELLALLTSPEASVRVAGVEVRLT